MADVFLAASFQLLVIVTSVFPMVGVAMIVFWCCFLPRRATSLLWIALGLSGCSSINSERQASDWADTSHAIQCELGGPC
jgi:hypothetical protein